MLSYRTGARMSSPTVDEAFLTSAGLALGGTVGYYLRLPGRSRQLMSARSVRHVPRPAITAAYAVSTSAPAHQESWSTGWPSKPLLVDSSIALVARLGRYGEMLLPQSVRASTSPSTGSTIHATAT